MQKQALQYDSLYTQSMRTLQTCQDDNKKLTKQKSVLQDQANNYKEQLTATQDNNAALRKELQSMSAISAAQAESIRKSMDNMGAKDTYIMALHSAIGSRDSANVALVLELKAAIGGYSAQGLDITLENGVVHLDLKDSLLFGGDTTSYTITDPAKQILQRLARVLNDHPSVEFMIEAHTDTLSLAQDSIMDSWDLSTKRATAIARLMQTQYKVAPTRITAAGRGEYAAAAATDSAETLIANHRTRIIFQPQVDQLMRLLDHKQANPAPAPPAPTPAPPPPAPEAKPSTTTN
jgi:chemotaxis protein MotB